MRLTPARSTSHRGRLVFALAGVVLVLTATACSDEASREPGGQKWPTGEPLDASGLVWGKGHTVHLGDGTEIDTKRDFNLYAVAGDAVWFTELNPEDSLHGADDGRLWRATKNGVERTDAYSYQFAATTDGRYLVYLDHVSGPEDDHGTAAYLLVVVDTETGEETIRTTEGMEDPLGQGLDVAYEDGAPWLVAVTDTTAYVRSFGEYRAFDLASGEVEVVDGDEVPDPSEESGEPVWNESHSWRIHRTDTRNPLLVGEDGTRVRPKARDSEWALLRWLDDHTVLALSQRRAGGRDDLSLHPGDRNRLMTCQVPTGACSYVPGATRKLAPAPSALVLDSSGFPEPSLLPQRALGADPR